MPFMVFGTKFKLTLRFLSTLTINFSLFRSITYADILLRASLIQHMAVLLPSPFNSLKVRVTEENTNKSIAWTRKFPSAFRSLTLEPLDNRNRRLNLFVEFQFESVAFQNSHKKALNHTVEWLGLIQNPSTSFSIVFNFRISRCGLRGCPFLHKRSLRRSEKLNLNSVYQDLGQCRNVLFD